MIRKQRATKSVLQNNMGGTDKEIVTDTTLPQQLWEVDKYTRTPSKLSAILEKKMILNRVIESISFEKETLIKDVNTITNDFKDKITFYKSNLSKEKYIKEAEFKTRKKEIEDSKIEYIKTTGEELLRKEQEERDNFEHQYKTDLKNIYDVYIHINEILDKYQVKITEYIEPYEGNWDEISIEDVKMAVNKIESSMDALLEDGMVINKALKKVKSFDKKQNTALGAGLVATTFLAAPVALLTAGVTVGITISQNKKVTEELSKYCVQLVQLRDITQYLYNKRKENNTIDLSNYEREINNVYITTEEHANKKLKEIQKEEANWKADYEKRLNVNYVKIQNELQEEQMKAMKEKYVEKEKSLQELKQSAEKQYNTAVNQVEKKNIIKPIKSYENEEKFKKLQEIKKINNEFLKYNILKKLDYKKKEEMLAKYGENMTEELKQQLEYDHTLYYDEFLPLETKIKAYEEFGMDRDAAKKQLTAALQDETPFYLLDTNQLHLGTSTKSSKYINLDESEEVFAEDWNNASVLFIYKNEEEEKVLINFIKYLLFQCMAQQTPSALEVNICNPTMDSKFNDILINTTTLKDGREVKNPEYCTNYSGEKLEQLVKRELDTVMSRYNKELVGDKTLSDVVKEKRELGSKVPKYIINVIHRAGISSQLIELNENSQTTGIINFVLVNYYDIMKEKETKGIKTYLLEDYAKERFKKDKVLVEVASILNDTDSIINIFTKDRTNYKQIRHKIIPPAVITDYTNFMEERYKRALKLNSITMIDEFISQLIGEDIWSGKTDKDIKLYFGYVDGDKSKPLPVVIDEQAKVHAFMGGTTGGGKSVTLAAVVNVLKAMYPPSELEIYYYDFKKVEVANHIKPYKWPNASAMSASETGDYLISLIKDIEAEMMQRYADMNAVGVTKLSDYRKFMRKKKEEFIAEGKLDLARKVKVPPRVLIIIDEVQQAFSISDDVTDAFKESVEAIARLARAAGLHMFFVSQDPGNKIPGNVMDLFAIRACTKATPSVSDAVLRNKFASLPENQFIGFLGVNTSPDGADEENIQYVVPLTEVEDSRLYGKITYDKAIASTEESGDRPRDAIIFNDDEKYSYKQLFEYLNNNKLDYGEVVLGEVVQFQLEYKPATIELAKDQNQGLSFISADQNYKKDFFRTLMASINNQGSETVVYFGGSRDPIYDLDLVKNQFIERVHILDSKTGRRIESFEEIVKEISPERVEHSDAIKQLEGEIKSQESSIRRKKLNLESHEESLSTGQFEEGETFDGVTEEVAKLKDEISELEREIADNKDKIKYHQEEFNRYIIKKEKTAYMESEHYGEAPGWRGKEQDNSMNGIIKKHIRNQIVEAKKARRDGLEFKPKYVICIDPEKDPYVMQEGAWRDKEFIQVVNEGTSFGIYFISITSEFDRIATASFNRYILGILPGEDANSDKAFRNLTGDFVQVSNTVKPSENFKFKMATDNLVSLMPWER